MDGRLKIIGGGYFFVFLCVYAAHNYMQKMNEDLNNIKPDKYAIFDILYVIKFLGAFLLSNIADRTQKHTQILLLGLFGYLFFLYLVFYGHGDSSDGFSFVLIMLYRSASIFFLSGVFPILDVVCLNYLESIDKERVWYGRVRMASCAGHSLGALSVKVGDKIAKEHYQPAIPLFFTGLFGSICLLFVWITFDVFKTEKTLPDKTKVLSLKEKLRNNFKYINDIFTVDIMLLLIAVILQGIHRQAISSYLEAYYNDFKIERKKIAVIFAVRCLPEAFMLYITPYCEKLMGIYWMFFLGIIFGIARPLAYAFVPLGKYSNFTLMTLIYSLEISKGIFSALFSYSVSKIVKEITTNKTKSVAQGLYNGCYSGLAPAISGVLCFFILKMRTFPFGLSKERFLFMVTGVLGAIGLIFVFVLIGRRKIKSVLLTN